MEWVRGDTVGHGSFATVSLAIPKTQSLQFPPLMAVKSTGLSHSASLMNEKSILDELRDSPEIIGCFGDCFSFENGEKLYNVLLEYAPGGALSENLKNFGDRGFPEYEVRRYTKSILKGLRYIHKFGYVHCDIKLQNILLGPNNDVKIADFGLSKKVGAKNGAAGCELRGTPLYMSPEMVAGGEQDYPADIWALGCVVTEMITGVPAWTCRPESDVMGLLMRIGSGDEVPEIPGKVSIEGQDFLGKCFVKNPSERWTAEMLLEHPFIAAVADDEDDEERITIPLKDVSASISPRCPFDFPDCLSELSSMTCSISIPSTSPEHPNWSDLNSKPWLQSESKVIGGACPAARLRLLVTDQNPEWSVSDSWVSVR